MKTFPYILLGIFLIFIVTANAYADTSVVNVQSTVNSSSTTTSNSSSHCTIHTESNGNVQDYNSDDCNNVHITNGGSSVNINNNTNSTNDPITPLPTIPPIYKTFPTIVTPTMPPTPTIKIHEEQIKEFHKALQQQKNFIENFQTWIKSFFASLHF